MLDRVDSQQEQLNALEIALNKNFMIDASSKISFELFPFSNEGGFYRILKCLRWIGVNDTKKLKVAILFGESNFLSLSPNIPADLILLADFNPQLHKHTKFLMECFSKSETPQQFIECYRTDNPITAEKIFSTSLIPPAILDIDVLITLLNQSAGYLKKFHFLNSQERFQQCKKAFNKIRLLQINLDLTHDQSCSKLAALLSEHNAVITISNFNNIHNYADREKLSRSIPSLLQNAENSLVMFSTGPERQLAAHLAIGLRQYFVYALNKLYKNYRNLAAPSTCSNNKISNNASSLFYRKVSTQYEKEINSVCYVGFMGEKEKVKKIIYNTGSSIDNFGNINSFSNRIHAFETEDEARKFIENEAKIIFQGFSPPEEDCWIFTVRGDKDKVNALLKYLNDDNRTWRHYPLDYVDDGLEFSSRVIEAVNITQTAEVTKRRLGNRIQDEVGNLFRFV